ncbi:TPA: type III secretion system needle complex protein [Salmonella enterica]|nr:EscF/YscF/HrpA family type III secretion system needle major subunit [Salmonella enterica subsp. diarizonae]HEA0263521.1 type III secretion system needle complex protein [Salmonella enterica]HEA0268616.1 type III secretion system needle complex protein [Salmonella enterica]HEA0295553.1 type III secretion system needle complex protein [Salmonella enterica]HEA0304662.1 type III secretion system needle complex protein [Salmonella enterica]
MSEYNGYIDRLSQRFNDGVTTLQKDVDLVLEKLASEPTNPSYLAEYQSKLSEYNLYRNAQSNVVKAYKDIDAAIVQNFR